VHNFVAVRHSSFPNCRVTELPTEQQRKRFLLMRFLLPSLCPWVLSVYGDQAAYTSTALSLTDRFLAITTTLPTAPCKQMSRYDSKQESPAHHPIALLPAAASVFSLISGFNPITSVAGVPAATQADTTASAVNGLGVTTNQWYCSYRICVLPSCLPFYVFLCIHPACVCSIVT
jgi:hypothetical protein